MAVCLKVLAPSLVACYLARKRLEGWTSRTPTRLERGKIRVLSDCSGHNNVRRTIYDLAPTCWGDSLRVDFNSISLK